MSITRQYVEISKRQGIHTQPLPVLVCLITAFYAKQMNEPLDDLVKHCKKRLLFDKPRGLRTMLKGETHSKRWMIRRICGDVAQLGERSVRNAEVVGSIPIVSTT